MPGGGAGQGGVLAHSARLSVPWEPTDAGKSPLPGPPRPLRGTGLGTPTSQGCGNAKRSCPKRSLPRAPHRAAPGSSGYYDPRELRPPAPG